MKFEKIYSGTEENLRLALLSLWAPGQHPMRPAIEDLFKREPLLAEPVFQGTFGWKKAEVTDTHSAIDPQVWDKLENMRRAERGDNFRPFTPFEHQTNSWNALANGKSIVVTSGTGSGKTECFMYPVLSDLYKNKDRHVIEAIFLYPLNALMEDQKKRLSEYCEATGLHFATYNGDTPESIERGDGVPKSEYEVTTREAIRNKDTRPEILLTNPSMLEYILVRQKDQEMLKESQGKLRWIVIDEAHSYSGSAAVELRYQIKRILDAFDVRADDVRFACTSATIGGDDGNNSLKEYISDIVGQSPDKIEVIGGQRILPELNEESLVDVLKSKGLPAVENVVKLRNKINSVSGLTLSEIWSILKPGESFVNPDGTKKVTQALRLLDDLCELQQDGNPVLSLRGHFFMRSISGLYGCANKDCKDANNAVSAYGHLTTQKASVCPTCHAPLLEILKCKRCGSFVVMGCSDSKTHRISPCEDNVMSQDYFALDPDPEDEDVEDTTDDGNPDVFFLKPYDKEKFFNPVAKTQDVVLNMVHKDNMWTLEPVANREGQWVEVRKSSPLQSFCPGCGTRAQGKKSMLKHFRIPINFINQAISPVLLEECAPNSSPWGKYIAFTDSRQGTAISAKTFNVTVERNQSAKYMLAALAEKEGKIAEERKIQSEIIPEDQRDSDWAKKILDKLCPSQYKPLSLEEVADDIYDNTLAAHIMSKDIDAISDDEKNGYEAALLRSIVGRRPLYESNAETQGLVYLKCSKLKGIHTPDDFVDYFGKSQPNISEIGKEWQNFLKISIDYVLRLNNHIQALEGKEDDFVRESNRSKPIAAPDDLRPGLLKWPQVKVNEKGEPKEEQPRLVLLLCAALNIDSLDKLKNKIVVVNNILKDAWKALKENILSPVDGSDSKGYNNPIYKDKYKGCYNLDLSKKRSVCQVDRLDEAWLCPVTNKLLDTTFFGYSPMIFGRVCRQLFDKYKCSPDPIKLPCRPANNDEVSSWLESDEAVQNLKGLGLWTDRHKYVYRKTKPYIAAEHSAQQSKALLRKYTEEFSKADPTVNVLHCSTTMEMGVDIGDIDVVLMDTIPPTAANYMQRVGRAGRAGQSKAIAFSLCNDTPVGKKAFDNPMWALNDETHKSQVKPSKTIIQRHINSYLFREFICSNGDGISVAETVEGFMGLGTNQDRTLCDDFVDYLDKIECQSEAEDKFHSVFGEDQEYATCITKDMICEIRQHYCDVIKELDDALSKETEDSVRGMAISNQIRRIREENLLGYLSEQQFFPNANMPTGIVTFSFVDRGHAQKLHRKYVERDKQQAKYFDESDASKKNDLKKKIGELTGEINALKRMAESSRDIRTALSEYAPGQTVVVNEKNYVSAGIVFRGAYREETDRRALYFCKKCGNTLYEHNIEKDRKCKCGHSFHGILDENREGYTLAYEPVGFCVDPNREGSREEKTNKQYYDIRPILTNVTWNEARKDVYLCEIVDSGKRGKILYANEGLGYGFAFCKRCGRAVLEETNDISDGSIPLMLRGHKKLSFSGDNICDANPKNSDIARHVVFTGEMPTCYVVFRFKKDAEIATYEKDEELAYSLGVILRRALAKKLGIDEGEIDFGVKQERDNYSLFIYDTARGGCGYSLSLRDSGFCQDVFELALHMLEGYNCECHKNGGACSQCLIDRNSYRFANKLSKAKALEWLKKQTEGVVKVPDTISKISPSARVAYHSLKTIVMQAIKDAEVKAINLFVSDVPDDCDVSEWRSRKCMGVLLDEALRRGKKINVFVEYHSDKHLSLSSRLPFANLKQNLVDCNVSFIKDMGRIKTAILVERTDGIRRYFTDDVSLLSFSADWGCEGSRRVFEDRAMPVFDDQDEPRCELDPSCIIRQGIPKIRSFKVENYYSDVISTILQPQDEDIIREILKGKRVAITYSDLYVNCALSSLMLVHLIREMKNLFGFSIDDVVLKLGSKRHNWKYEKYDDANPIDQNFENATDADAYTRELFIRELHFAPIFSTRFTDHHRWLRIKTTDGQCVEIRPDHGVGGGYISHETYRDLDYLDGSVEVHSRGEKVLYYIIIHK